MESTNKNNLDKNAADKLSHKKGDSLLLKTNLISRYINSLIRYNLKGVYENQPSIKIPYEEKTLNVELKKHSETMLNGLFNNFISDLNESEFLINEVTFITKIIDRIIDHIVINKSLMIKLIDIKFFDEYTYSHSLNVTTLALIMGVELGLNKEELYELGVGALLHDIGKVFVSIDILNKNNYLTDKELKCMRKHPKLGFNHVKDNIDIPINSKLAILEHHEKVDGTGYPKSKINSEISLYAKIISICDVYDALASKRSYREAFTSSYALNYIMNNSGSYFDKEIAELFYNKFKNIDSENISTW